MRRLIIIPTMHSQNERAESLVGILGVLDDEVVKSLRGEDDLLRRIKGCLRHYPTKFDLTESCKKCPDIWGMP